jgi:hypothetical protein
MHTRHRQETIVKMKSIAIAALAATAVASTLGYAAVRGNKAQADQPALARASADRATRVPYGQRRVNAAAGDRSTLLDRGLPC